MTTLQSSTPHYIFLPSMFIHFKPPCDAYDWFVEKHEPLSMFVCMYIVYDEYPLSKFRDGNIVILRPMKSLLEN